MYGTNEKTYGSANTVAQEPARDATLLEDHLKVLHSHLQEGRHVAERLERIADRLVGAVPKAIGKDELGKASAGEPPLVMRIDYAGRDLSGVLSQIHDQITRFERL